MVLQSGAVGPHVRSPRYGARRDTGGISDGKAPRIRRRVQGVGNRIHLKTNPFLGQRRGRPARHHNAAVTKEKGRKLYGYGAAGPVVLQAAARTSAGRRSAIDGAWVWDKWFFFRTADSSTKQLAKVVHGA